MTNAYDNDMKTLREQIRQLWSTVVVLQNRIAELERINAGPLWPIIANSGFHDRDKPNDQSTTQTQ